MTTSHKPELTDELLSAYIDHAVTPDERQLVEQAAAADPEVAWRLESLQMTVQLLRELPALALPRSFVLAPEQVGEPVAEQTPAPFEPAATVLVPRRVDPPAQPGFWARLGAAWDSFWQAGSPALRNAMATSLVLLFVFLAAPRFLTAPSGVDVQTGVVAPVAESARSDKLLSSTAVTEDTERPASDTSTEVEAPAPESGGAAAAEPVVAAAPAPAAAAEAEVAADAIAVTPLLAEPAPANEAAAAPAAEEAVMAAAPAPAAAAEAEVAADAIAVTPLLAEPAPANEAAAAPAAEEAVMAAAPAAMDAGSAGDASPEGSDPLALARAAAPLAEDATVRRANGDSAAPAPPAQAVAAAPAPAAAPASAAPMATALPPLATDTPPATPTSEPTAAATATATALPTATAHATPTTTTVAVAASAVPAASTAMAAEYAAPAPTPPASLAWLYLAQIAAGAGFLLFGLLWWRSRR